MKGYLVIFFLFSCLYCTENANILAVFPLPGKSHFIMFEKILKGLVERGHEVDVMSHFPQETPIKGYNDLSLLGTQPIFTNNMSLDILVQNQFSQLHLMMKFAGYDTCEATFNSDIAKNLRNSSKNYDLVITEFFSTDCMLGWGYHFKAPVVALCSSMPLPWVNDRFGNPDNPSYIQSYTGGSLDKMTLYERIVNTYSLLFQKLFYSYFNNKCNQLAKDFFGEDMPDLEVLAYNTSLFLTNSHFSILQAKPMVPNVIEVGGVHISEPKPLNKHFQKLLKTDSKGIIFLTMGSMVITEQFPIRKLQGMADAFGELPYKVIWKGVKENFPKEVIFPENIYFENWTPQFDILCHPNVKLFVTHGGLMGSQEAIYCGVPRLGIPLFGDQETNVKQSEKIGVAIKVAYDNITKESILDAATKLLNDPSYQQRTKLISERFKDRPMSPLNTSLYWIEYVIRHKGAPQLRSLGADLPWYQYHLLDVAAISVMIPLVVGYLFVLVLKLILRSKTDKNKID